MSKVRGGQVFVEIGADPRKLFKALTDLNKSIGKIGASMTNLGTRMTAIGAAIAAPVGLAMRQFAQFDDAIRATAAVSQASGAELQKLNDKARELGATTSFTAVQVANLMTELGRAGFKPDEINAMTGAVLDLARATGTDAALSAGIMAASLRQFGLGATEAGRAADVLTKAANSTFNTVEGLGESLKYAGPVAKSLGLSLEDTTAILGVLGNVGIQGSEAGTALRRLSVISAASGEELQKLFGITNVDAAGNLKPLVDILDEINTATANMPVAERTAKMAEAFGLLGITSANVLSSSADGVRGLADQLRKAEGTAAKAAKEMDAGLGGALRIALSAVEGTALAIGDALAPSLQKLLNGVESVATGLTKFVKENEALVITAAKGIAIFTGVGVALVAVGSAIQLASFGIGGLLSAIGGIAAIAIGPISLLVASITGVGGAFASAVPGVVAFGATAGKTIAMVGTSVAGLAANASAQVASFAIQSAGHMAAFAATSGRSFASFSMAAATAAKASAATIAPAVALVAKGFGALAADAARLVAPLTLPFVVATRTVGRFAVSAGASVAAYVGSMATATAATATSTAAMAAAWLGSALRAVSAFATGCATQIAAYVASTAGAATASMASAAGIAAAWLATAFPATTTFVAGAVSGLATYVGSAAGALAASVASAAGVSVAWVSSGMPGLATFVAGAVSGLAAYVGSCAMAVATSVASAAAVATAWLAPVAPVLAIGAAVAGAGVLAYQFGGQMKGALAGVGDMVGQAAGAIGSGFNAAVSDGMVVLGDLASTASTTFNGIYEAIADGDLSGAMDVLWAGLVAGWLRGVEAIMGYVDPWISMFQNAFTILGAEIYKTWDWTWTSIAGAFNTVGAVIQGAMDNVINGVMAAWDRLEAGIRKSWNYIQSFFKKGMDLKEENNKVDSEMAARARKRELERPGVEGRMDAAAKDNKRKKDEMWARQDAVDDNTQATVDGREAENRRRADQRRADTQAAEGNLAGKARGKRENRARNDQFTRLLKDIDGATTLDSLRGMYEEFDALSSNGRLTSGQMATLETALEDAQERVSKATSSMGGTSPSEKIAAGAGAAGGEAAKSQSEVVGTFSSNLSGMGFGSSLAQKQVDLLGKIEQNTRDPDQGLVGD